MTGWGGNGRRSYSRHSNRCRGSLARSRGSRTRNGYPSRSLDLTHTRACRPRLNPIGDRPRTLDPMNTLGCPAYILARPTDTLDRPVLGLGYRTDGTDRNRHRSGRRGAPGGRYPNQTSSADWGDGKTGPLDKTAVGVRPRSCTFYWTFCLPLLADFWFDTRYFEPDTRRFELALSRSAFDSSRFAFDSSRFEFDSNRSEFGSRRFPRPTNRWLLVLNVRDHQSGYRGNVDDGFLPWHLE